MTDSQLLSVQKRFLELAKELEPLAQNSGGESPVVQNILMQARNVAATGSRILANEVRTNRPSLLGQFLKVGKRSR